MSALYPRYFLREEIGYPNIFVLVSPTLGRQWWKSGEEKWGMSNWVLAEMVGMRGAREISLSEAKRLGLPMDMKKWPEEISKAAHAIHIKIAPPKVCQNYEEAREALRDSALQFWDGADWQDVPPGVSVFFARLPEDYRRRPTPEEAVPNYYVYDSDGKPGKRANCFETADQVATFLWGKDMKDIGVFKRIRLQSLDISKIRKQLEEI